MTLLEYQSQRLLGGTVPSYDTAKAVRHIDVNGRRYRFVYSLRYLPALFYLMNAEFQDAPLENLHYLAASLTVPQCKLMGILPYTDDVFEMDQFENYAMDMLDAPAEAVMGSVLGYLETYLSNTWDVVIFGAYCKLALKPQIDTYDPAQYISLN